MSRRNSFSTPGVAAIESLEPKQLLSGTTIDTASVSAEVQSALEQPAMRPKMVYDGVTDAEQFWGEGSRGEGAINDQRQLASAAEFVPTEEDPLTIRMQFSIQGKAGVVIATRTEGVANQQVEKEFERGLVFTVEYNGMSVYQYDPAGGAYVVRYVQFPSLENGAVYDLLIEDKGTQAHIRLERAGDVILDQTGAVSRQTGLGGIVVRKQNMNTAVRLDVPSLSIAHGQEPVPRDTEETPSAPQIVSGVTDELPTVEVDKVFGNVTRLLQAWEEQRAEAPAKPSPVLFSTEGREAFWEGVEAGSNINLNDRRQLTSVNEVIPTEEDPLSIRMQFSIQGKAGVVIATRTEGAANQQVEKEFERGLVFTVEYNGMSVYQYDPAGGAYVIRYVQFPSLENGAVYDLLIEDKGTQAHIRLERAGDVILDQTGAVNRQTGLGGIVVRKQNPGLEPTVNIPSLTIAHGNDAQAESANLATTPAATASAPSTVERGDARLALISSMDYGNPALTGAGRADLFQQSRFAEKIDVRARLALHPNYGGHSGVNRDLENEFERSLGIYTDVVGDMLTRGMEVRLAELKGEPIQKPLEMMHWIVANRWKSQHHDPYFGLHLPTVNQVLEESARLFDGNLDRMIDYQQAIQLQNWKDTHEGDTGTSQHVRTPEAEAALQARLREIMVYTATVIGNYSSDVRAEFASAVTNAGFSVQEIYAEAGLPTGAVAQAGVADTTLVADADGTVLGQSSEVHVDLGSFTPARITAWYRTELPTFGIRTDSAAGQALIGIIDRLHPAMETQELADIARSIEYFTAIPWWKIAQAAESANGDSDVLAGNMLGLFHDAGFTHLLEPSSAATPQFLSTHQHKTEYLGEDMLIRFDLASAGKQIDHTFAYLFGHNGQIGDALPVEIDGLFARIPASVIDERIGDVENAHLQVKLVTWFAGQGDEGRITTTTEGVMWSKNIGDYSTRPESDPRNAIEDAILSQLSAHFPVVDPQQWKQTIGSPYHLGAARMAIDLNLQTGGNQDYGQPVYAIADGRIVGTPDAALGAVTLEHSIVVNGQTIVWRSRYLHLPIEEENGKYFVRRREDMTTDSAILYEQELSEGATFSAGEQFAVVGVNATTLAHLHLEILASSGERIDARRVLENKGVISRATDESGREWDVTWNEQEKAWVNTAQGILFVQDGNTWSDGADNVWVAWSEDVSERKSVVWIESLPDGRKVNAWVSTSDFSQQWNPITREFSSL